MALYSLVTDLADDDVLLAIVADDEAGEYVWPPDVEPWFDGHERVAYLLDVVEQPPTAEADWVQLLASNLGTVSVGDPQSFDTIEEATSAAEEALASASSGGKDADKTPSAPGQDPDPTGLLRDASDAFDDVSQDYPGFGESADNEGENPQAMLNFLMSALGPIDPSGPNGWILRAAEGTPHEGEDQMLIHFPGTMPPSEVLDTQEGEKA